MTDLYEILQVSTKADSKRITAAYRSLVKDYHPDVNKDPEAARKFREIHSAYEILSDPAKRREYDRRHDLQYEEQRPTYPPPVINKDAFWARHEPMLMALMTDWKRKYFYGMAAIYHNDFSMAIPPINSPEMTIPNITCRGSGENIGVWCEDTADAFVAGIFYLGSLYVACRQMVLAEDLEQALQDCVREIQAIRGTNR